jgi:uncharacterized protein (DUF2062 family)
VNPATAAARESFWRRRVVNLIVAQLKQGITPDKIALTIALGAVLAVFPILGSTTILCAVVAAWLRLNQPVIQLVNWLVYPLQFVLLIPFYRAGEWFGTPHLALSIPQLVERFRNGPLQFILDFGTIALGGIAVWCVLAPLAAGAMYVSLRTPLRLLAARNRIASR